MADRDPQDTEILAVIGDSGDRVEPQALIDKLLERSYDMASVIEALQRAIERGKISLNSDGMVVSIARELAHAA
jgi:hypothetical protein